MKMKKTVSKTIVIVFAFLTASCASQKKFDFKNAYKFDRINYNKTSIANHKQTDTMNEIEIEKDLTSIQNIPGELARLNPTYDENSYYPQQFGMNAIPTQNLTLTKSLKEMTRVERKQFKREFRQTIRDIKNDQLSNRQQEELLASMAGISSIQDDGGAKKQRRIARFLLIGGGALVIIAVIVGSFSIVGTIGVVAVIAGAVLMLLSLDK